MNHTEKSKKTMTLTNNNSIPELTKTVKVSEYFNEIFSENADLKHSLQDFLGKISRLMIWQSAELWIVSGENSFSNIVTYSEKIYDSPVDESLRDNIIREVFQSKEMKVLDYEEKYPDKGTQREELDSLLALPVKIDNKKFAVLIAHFINDSSTNYQSTDLLKNISIQIGNLIKIKLLEENLINDEIQLRKAQKIANLGSFEWDLKNDNFSISGELSELLGLEVNEKKDYQSLYMLVYPPDKQKVEKIVKSISRTKKLSCIECRVLNGAGKLLDVLIKMEPVKARNGFIEKLIGTMQDITIQKETEKALRRSEEYFRSLIENSLDMKSIIGPEGKIKYMSPSIEKILGYSPEELIGEDTCKYIHPDDVKYIKSVFNDIVKMPGFTTSVEFRVKHKKGRWCIIQSLIKNLLNNPVVSGIIASSRDITSKKEAENSIKLLLAISEKLNSTLDVDIIMDILISEAINLVGAEGGCTGLKTTEGLTCKKYFHKDLAENFEFCWPPGVGLPGWLILNKVPYITNDAAKDPIVLKELVDKFNINSVACIPILDIKNEVIGFLEVKNKLNHTEFTEEDKDKLVSLTQIASITIQNALAYQKIQMAEFQIKTSREQLRRLSAHLQSAREEERTRIAREIHDELGQALTGLKMDISWLSKKIQNMGTDNQQLLDKAAGMSALVDTTIKSVRKISSELRPGVLDYLGLPAAIEWQAQDFQNRTGISCNIISLPKDLQLDQNKSTAIFRIFQETLTNVARHAQATIIEIELVKENDKLILKIKDNGRGITDNELLNTGSFGILGMRERTLLLGGEFSISGESNKGTTVSVKIPVTESNYSGGIL